jgi:hypothetical protein
MRIDFKYDVELCPGKFPLPGVGPFSLLCETKMNQYGKIPFRWMTSSRLGSFMRSPRARSTPFCSKYPAALQLRLAVAEGELEQFLGQLGRPIRKARSTSSTRRPAKAFRPRSRRADRLKRKHLAYVPRFHVYEQYPIRRRVLFSGSGRTHMA